MHAYKKLEERFIKEIGGTGCLYEHIRSGAKIFNITNEDDNKVFSISFKTPPMDNTGLTHILEHSVLSGSKNFPTKEPFVDLAKGSLNTFLNALTFSDKTMYPVASRNRKDFYNLMEVYLDAVFYPKIYEHKEIFEQEGWHYEINSAEEELRFQGVVYNEMLGAFSSAEEILFSRIMEVLYKDTCYGFEAGGEPDCIPELTYENFLNYHKNFYQPSNAYIYIYGDERIDDLLEFMDKKYLSHFERGAVAKIELQRAFEEPQSKLWEYPVSSVEEEDGNAYLSINYVTGLATDPELTIAMDILEYILLETPASPMKQALIDSELGTDVIGNFDQGILQPMFNIVLKYSDLKHKNDFMKIVQKTLKSVVQNGIEPKLIDAAINSLEFKLREANGEDTPRGLLYGVRCMDSFIYNENPYVHLEYEYSMTKIREKAHSGYFESLIQKYLLDNPHSAFIALVPSHKLYHSRIQMQQEKMKQIKFELCEDEIDLLIEKNKRLKERQITPDLEEDLLKIPLLSLEDIRNVTERPQVNEKQIEDCGILYTVMNTNDIIYMELFFDTAAVKKEDLLHMVLLSDLLGLISTKEYSYGELSNEVDIHTGGISFDVDAYEDIIDGTLYHKFIVQAKTLSSNLEKLFSLIVEILNHSKYRSKRRILELLREIRSDMEIGFIDEGHEIAVKRLCAYFSEYACHMENITGLSYYDFIVKMEEDYDKAYPSLVRMLERNAKKIFTRKHLTVSIVCDEQNYKQFERYYPQFVDNIVQKVWKTEKYDSDPVDKNEGVINTGSLQHIAKGYNFKTLGYSYSGEMQVLKNILSLDYLWKRIRLQQGAYGVFARFEMGGNAYFVSYRDPMLRSTLECFDQAADYVKIFEVSDREMTKYIIGTISALDQPLSPEQTGQRNSEMYFRRIKSEDLAREREEILGTTVEKIRTFAPMIEKLMKQNYYCAVGNEVSLRNEETLFDRIFNVFDDKTNM